MNLSLPQFSLAQPSSLFGVLAGAAPDAGESAGTAPVFTLTAVSLSQTETAVPFAPRSIAPVVASEKPQVSATELLASLDRSARTAIAPAPILVAVDPALSAGTMPLINEELPVATAPPIPAGPPVATKPAVTGDLPTPVAPPVREQLPVAAKPPTVEQVPNPAKPVINDLPTPVAVPVSLPEQRPAIAKPAVTEELPVDTRPPVTERLPASVLAKPTVDPKAPTAPHLAIALPTPVETKLPAEPKAPSTDDDAAPDSGEAEPQPVLIVPQPVHSAVVQPVICMAPPVVAQAIVTEAQNTVAIKASKSTSVRAAPSAEVETAPTAASPVATKPERPLDIAPLVLPKDMSPIAEPLRKNASVEVSVTMLSDTASDADTVPTFVLPTATSVAPAPASASPVQQPVAAADVMVNRHLDLARGDAWLDTLAQDIAAIAGTGDRLKFALQPEHLGKLDVEVSRHDNGVAVHMTTRNEDARAIIAAAQPRLLDELRANGTRVVAADVTSQMNAQTDGQSGNASRRPAASFIEAAIDVRTPAANTNTDNAPAAGRYA